MSSIVVLSGSPSATSRTAALAEHLAERLRGHGHDVRLVRVRDLPPKALLHAEVTDPAIVEVTAAIAGADGVVVASPVYKAAYTGLLKSLLDLLPQFALAGKAALPVLTGGSPAHVLALDYALRPVLSSLGAHHIVPGWFVLDQHIEVTPTGVVLHPDAEAPLLSVVDTFAGVLPAGALR
ncbi:NADPH-dependent FMN reductase [Actinokineospora sp. NBRC 105648]|uniref:NADPH-dependent FMN reductase n=1 Tax=Actinokineospora sp. NBRC 105648 TaxID=3032206 RepID=UPI0024A0BA8C|nr:NADPH-dependent FMN reductase [Actinokineospora sp. NBRC 105648]GLZ41420.1 FMN reductase (NADPH) [Actinokineospora sp. NBRC 105648]